VLVGVFATELANESWDLVQKEVKADKARKNALAAEALEAEDGEADSWDGMVGPLNTTAVRSSAAALVPEGVRDEFGAIWSTVDTFCDVQWEPAVRQAVLRRRRETARQERAQARLDEILSGGNMGRGEALAQLLAEGSESDDTGKLDEQPTKADLEARSRLARWSLDGPQPWRQIFGATLFGFAMAGAARRQWVDYPDSMEALDAIVNGTAAGVGGVAGIGGASAVIPTAIPSSQAVAEGTVAVAEVVAAGAEGAGGKGVEAEAAVVAAAASRDLAQRQEEIDARRAEIEDRLRRVAEAEEAITNKLEGPST